MNSGGHIKPASQGCTGGHIDPASQGCPYLDGVRVTGLTENLQQGRVRHEEESREHQTLLLKVTWAMII